MKKNILIGFLFLIIVFLVPIWVTNRLHRESIDIAIANHGNSLVFINRKFIAMQVDIAYLIESNDKLRKRLGKYEAINESFEKIIEEKYPHFIEEEVK